MHNQLIDFLIYLQPEEKQKLATSIKSSGKQAKVWQYALEKAQQGRYNKEEALKEINATDTHFEKMCSVLLSRCYTVLFPEGGLPLLRFLNSYMSYTRHFYMELNKQLKALSKMPKSEAKKFLKLCVSLHIDRPIAFRNETAFAKISKAYLSYTTPETKIEDRLFISCKEIWIEIDQAFASGKIDSKEIALNKRLKQLLPDFNKIGEDSIFEYYWTTIYLKHATFKYEEVVELINTALQLIRTSKANITQLRLKRAEAFYYVSRFEEAYKEFHDILYEKADENIVNSGYFSTKFLQICLITGHFDKAKIMLDDIQRKAGVRFKELIAPRDIISFVKYHLLVGDYDKAIEYIRLGYEKNPRNKYFQYEIELRNLETAYFYLTNNELFAVQMCQKHIKFLRNHGYSVRDSLYAQYYVLIRLFYKVKYEQQQLFKKDWAMYEQFQTGSRAVYGRILKKIKEA